MNNTYDINDGDLGLNDATVDTKAINDDSKDNEAKVSTVMDIDKVTDIFKDFLAEANIETISAAVESDDDIGPRSVDGDAETESKGSDTIDDTEADSVCNDTEAKSVGDSMEKETVGDVIAQSVTGNAEIKSVGSDVTVDAEADSFGSDTEIKSVIDEMETEFVEDTAETKSLTNVVATESTNNDVETKSVFNNVEDDSVAEAESIGSNVEDQSVPNDTMDLEEEFFGCEDDKDKVSVALDLKESSVCSEDNSVIASFDTVNVEEAPTVDTNMWMLRRV